MLTSKSNLANLLKSTICKGNQHKFYNVETVLSRVCSSERSLVQLAITCLEEKSNQKENTGKKCYFSVTNHRKIFFSAFKNKEL